MSADASRDANAARAYDSVAAAIHWVTAAMVVALLLLALFDDAISDGLGIAAVPLHKSLGITVFVLTLVRIGWRFRRPPPPLQQTGPAWQRRAAAAAHAALYGFLIAMPLLGYVLSSGGPYPLRWFGIGLPKLPVDRATGTIAGDIHVAAGYAMIALILVHVAAALWHQFALRDRTLGRMRLGPAPE
ncbi:cytochrome b [Sphingomonas canadensis]|uniref:Cytochrome b n=1 Tax=Sphingomonas canadensis TaxID=1219257 RepID=A0ABW3HAX8_9SPHN|nr:cytochrome b [Sphingomonas canadensis]MCW3838331.1 cytochrome b [Sphingomonas canadensis]